MNIHIFTLSHVPAVCVSELYKGMCVYDHVVCDWMFSLGANVCGPLIAPHFIFRFHTSVPGSAIAVLAIAVLTLLFCRAR